MVCGAVLGHQERAGISERVNEPGYGDVGIRGMVDAEAESRITRGAKINVKFPAMHLSQSHAAGRGAIDGDEKLIPARRRRRTRAKTSWNQTVGIAQAGRGDVKGNGVNGAPGEHGCAIESKDPHALKAKSNAIEQVDREVIGVFCRAPAAVPHRQLRVITDPSGIGRVMLDRIEEPAPTDWVACLRYTDALVEWSGAGQRAGKGKIAHHPAIGLMIIKDEPIAIVEARTRRAYQGQEERVVGRSIGAIERITVFIKNLDRAIDRLDIMIRADIAIGVRRQTETTTLA